MPFVERGDFTDRDFRDYQEDPTLIGNNRTDPTTRLTIGKRLSDQVEFTVSQNLRENGKATFVISYFPRRTIELRALSRDSGTVSLGVRHQLTFGGGESRPPSERRVRLVISEITFAGSDAENQAVAQAEIELEVGDELTSSLCKPTSIARSVPRVGISRDACQDAPGRIR